MLQGRAGRRCFLSIGIQDYAFRPLKHAEKDAEILAFKFQTRNYRTKMVCNSPSRDVLDQQIQAFGRECVEESTELIVVYFAGYAAAGSGSRVRLLLQGAQHSQDVDFTRSIGVDELLESMLRLPRQNCFVLAVMDCGHSSIDVSLRQTCTHGLVANHWATLWSSSTAEVLDPSTETGYGALACGMLHHMVVDPQSNLQEISMKLDEHVAASTGNGQRVDVFLARSSIATPMIFSQEVWNPQPLAVSSIGRLRSSSSQIRSWGWRRCTSCCSALASLCCTRHRILYAIYLLAAVAILSFLILLALRSHRAEPTKLVTWTQ